MTDNEIREEYFKIVGGTPEEYQHSFGHEYEHPMLGKILQERDKAYDEWLNQTYDSYEEEPFATKLRIDGGDFQEYVGKSFEVVGRVTEKNVSDREFLPMWKIRMDGGKVLEVYPEEIFPSAMKDNGCPYPIYDLYGLTLSKSETQDCFILDTEKLRKYQADGYKLLGLNHRDKSLLVLKYPEKYEHAEQEKFTMPIIADYDSENKQTNFSYADGAEAVNIISKMELFGFDNPVWLTQETLKENFASISRNKIQELVESYGVSIGDRLLLPYGELCEQCFKNIALDEMRLFNLKLSGREKHGLWDTVNNDVITDVLQFINDYLPDNEAKFGKDSVVTAINDWFVDAKAKINFKYENVSYVEDKVVEKARNDER